MRGISTLFEKLPSGMKIEVLKRDADRGFFITAGRDIVKSGKTEEIRITGLKRWIALSRIDPYWIRPHFGEQESGIPRETQYLLWETIEGSYGIILPLVDGDVRTTLKGENSGLTFIMEGALPGEEPEETLAAFAAEGDDPYELSHNAVKIVSDRLRTFRIREEKKRPDFLDYLGWCTWDAFYHKVDEEKVFEGLESFKTGGVQPGFMILDDGGLDVKGDFLNDFAVHPVKFPKGLKAVVDRAKRDFGIKMFGLWHAFEGYWAGINPEGKLAEKYRLVHNVNVIRPWEPKDEDLYLVDPRDVHRFFYDFYRFLKSEGIDMLKVDGQSALELFTAGKLGRAGTMRLFQEAMQGAAGLFFRFNLIHCMCNSSDVAYNMMGSTVWRNSVDYFPSKPEKVQQNHIFINAMNSLWTSTFSIPDWDMFQTHNPEGRFHAAARAISGGPVYVCDKPGQQDFDLLGKMTISGGKVLVCSRPALPAKDCLFIDCRKEEKLLKVTNRTAAAGVLGLFHCMNGGGTITDSFSPDDIHDLKGELFAAWFNKAGEVKLLQRNQSSTVSLEAMDYELVSLSPVVNGAAPLGLLDKFNNTGAVEAWEIKTEKRFHARLADGGKRIGFYCSSKPAKVLVNGQDSDLSYDSITGLLVVSAPEGAPVDVEIIM